MNIKQINEALEEGQSLKTVAQAYSEIANLKIKRIRAEVERNRIFFKEIAAVYALIKNMAAGRKITITKPKQTISIVLTSNYRFYGKINADLLDFFTGSIQKLNTDVVYLGKAAIDYFKAQTHNPGLKSSNKPGLNANYTEVLLKKDMPDAQELHSLAQILSNYNRVLVFYSSMKSLMIQFPTVTDITASQANSQQPTANSNFKFIFEPELPKILQFFDSQIITLLLEGTFLESELSRTASRFISMDQAETQANTLIKQYQTLLAYAKRNMDNNTILENFATMMAVRKHD